MTISISAPCEAAPRAPGTCEESARSAPLHTRFAAAGSLVMLVGMLITGWWVTSEIQDSVTRNSAISTAIYMESFIAPLSQELSRQDTISPETARRLKALFLEPHLSERIASVKIWKKGGLIAYASDAALIGKRFEPSDPLRAAWQGELSAAFDDLEHPEDATEQIRDLPFLEVYNPIHSIYTGEIIAVAEFYQVATELEHDLFEARLTSWVVVATIGLATFALLFGIVRQGSRTIERQNHALEARFAEVTAMSEQNAALRRRIQAASRRAGEHNERFLRRISAELHDGPAQALALASLRLDSVSRKVATGGADEEIGVIRASLDDAMREIRSICRGLSLPEIERQSLVDVLQQATETHARRSGTAVSLEADAEALRTVRLDRSQLLCVYRFVQEGLNNAFRHAGGKGQRVSCVRQGDSLRVVVEDAGPGFDLSEIERESSRLGLTGLRERVESTGGSFSVKTAPGKGTRLVMTLSLGD